ncbi:hypothetical protein GWK08_09585 [Leptobacterium flavescens]|uniref:Blue (type 1) copper domain-containing protein n=1 Tax=Leptobacterium flavescens TaxID=472055 RepID=A0A6P0UPC7_9FLAO|nr:plastocyanin/azurin family copper-binding protein [Leptobacterium flavescens]NER13689.1 hypothetical protein [Leptobacterium flavescens]
MKKRLLVPGFLVLFVFMGMGYTALNKTPEPKTHIVEIKKLKFIPAELTVKKGDTVIWINKDFFPHDVTEEKKGAWSSSTLQKGESWKKVITESSDYLCNLHKVMKGKLIVM